jgi:predicted AlkP superfamily pyrophosphatase or phosphodiesterase
MIKLTWANSLFISILVNFLIFNAYAVDINDKSTGNTLVKKQTKTPVILISIDGFAQHYLTQYPTPNLHKLIKKSLIAKALLPIYPSKTFPNHLSIVTGVYPNKHGIIHNKFYDRKLNKLYHLGAGKEQPKWLKAKPVWTRAEQHNIKSAIYFWPESEAKVDGVLPTYVMPYNKKTPNLIRVNKIISWLSLPINKRPQFVAGYFSIVDSAGHHFGLGSEELAQAVQKIDDLIGILVTKLKQQLGNNFDLIIVSDHGMVQISANTVINWQDKFVSNAAATVVNGETQLLIYAKNATVTAALKKHFSDKAQDQYQVFNQANFPKQWHWLQKKSRTPDLIIDANVPYIFKPQNGDIHKATHGYDINKSSDLQAIFIAYGKNFKAGQTINAFENINVAPLILHLLNITDADNLDGSFSLFLPYLK